ncbi:MAG: oligosaccharide flippase family protein [Ignisphaera sp.]
MVDSDDIEVLSSAARNAFILSVGDFIYNAVLAVGAIAIARLLGSEGYGIYSLTFVVPLTLYSFINLGLDTATTRFTKLYLVERKFGMAIGAVRTSLILKGLIGVIGSSICFFYARPLATLLIGRPELDRYVMFASIAIILESLYTSILSIFIGFEEVWRSSAIKVAYSISRTAIAIALLAVGLQVPGAIAGYLAGLTLSVSIGLLFLASITKRVTYTGSSGVAIGGFYIARELVLYSLPLYTASLVNSITALYQNILLAYTLSNAEIGGYRALLNLQTLVLVILNPITVSLLPMFTNMSSSRGGEKLSTALARSNRYVAAVVVPLTLLSTVYSQEIIYVLYGAEYRFASAYLPLIFAPFLLAGLGSATIPQLFNALGKTKLNMYIMLTSTAILIPTSYILTVAMGYRLWGFLTSNIVVAIASTILYNIALIKSLGSYINIWRTIPIYIASLAALPAALLPLSIPLPKPITLLRIVIGGAMYISAYIILSTVFKAIREQDIEFFIDVFTGIPVVNSIVKPLATAVLKLMKAVNTLLYYFKHSSR